MRLMVQGPRGFVGRETTGGPMVDDLPRGLANVYTEPVEAMRAALAFPDALVVNAAWIDGPRSANVTSDGRVW